MKFAHRTLLATSFVILCFWGGTSALAQSFYEVQGTIYAPGMQPLGRIAVFLEDQTRARVGQSITDADGRYQFSRVVAGVYYIVVRPNDRQLQSAVYRIELINSARSGTSSSVERADITLSAVARKAEAPPTAATVFAQDVPPAAEEEYKGAMESLAKKNNEQAVEQLKRALQIFPNYFLASQQLGLIYVEGEKFQQAITPLVKAIEVNPKASPSYTALGIASVNLGRPDLAEDALVRARGLDNKSFRVHFYLGLALIDLNRLDEAEKSLKEALRLGGGNKSTSARLYLASIYSKRGQNRQAIDELEAYLRENPKAGNAAGVQGAIAKLKSKL
ncbi:MAG TPA: tetratricopeptide repeat protein [Pyrinomonadaceae bacterium]|jgi:tetratricopeptide (TPR) repeat protein|nr:tetratricopeptide repeat protein [Pyrinomonadaceae bacterium]